MADTRAQVEAFLDENWDPDLTVGEWWERLGPSGWAAPHWPVDAFGRGLSNAEAAQVGELFRRRGVLGPPGGIGLLLAGPTIWTHGTAEQKARLLPDILCGRVAWCQLFSEPGAGSDLAGLQTKAARDGDAWRVTGQKVWTSAGHLSQLGMLLARTDPGAPKHRGISWFVLDMQQPGVEIRSLRELTGRSHFDEVFLTDVVARDENVIGDLHDGWSVARTTLAFERAGLGAGSSGAAESSAFPGPAVGHLGRRAGDFVRRGGSRRAPTMSVQVDQLATLARRQGRGHEPLVRQRLAALHAEQRIGRLMAMRNKDLRRQGGVPGMGNIAKLRMSRLFREAREIGLELLGPRGTLHDYTDPMPTDDADALAAATTGLALWSPAPSIYGGTDEIQRNILAERVLGLPKEPG